MRPALSVIAFTTLSGAGYGLMAWLAVAALAGSLPARPLLHGLLLALVLVTVGLLSSLAHLGQPRRAWRAYSQWRTSWLSREGVLATLTYAPALAFGALLLPGMLRPGGTAGLRVLSAAGMLVCIALIACAVATVACTAMIYASLPPIPAWRHRLVLPTYLLLAAWTGGLLLAALLGFAGADLDVRWLWLAVVAAAVLGLMKWRYWRDIDREDLPMRRGDAVGLPDREVTVFERPHTEASYITREMVFVMARRHARGLRLLAVVLVAVVPIVGALLAVSMPAPPALLSGIAAVSALAGAFVERWLFFAQARHIVSLYY